MRIAARSGTGFTLDRANTVLLALSGFVLIAAAWVPVLRLPLYIVAAGCTLAAVVWRIRSNHLRPRSIWVPFAAMIALTALGHAVELFAGRETIMADTLILLAHACALPSLALLLSATWGSLASGRGYRAELALLLAAAATTTAQVAVMRFHRSPTSLLAMHGVSFWRHVLLLIPSGPIDTFLICLLLRLLITRGYLPRALRSVLWGSVTLLIYDVAASGKQHRLASAGSVTLLIGILAMIIVLAAILQPGIAVSVGGLDYPAPPGSLRLVAGIPIVLAPPAVWLLGLTGVLPRTPAAFVAVAESALTLLALILAFQSLREAEEHAERDVITGLLNRRGLARATQKLLSSRPEHSSASLAVIDLDGFKQVNDQYGHDVGDDLLRAVGQRLRQVVGQHGVACRIGGDEFVVVHVQENADERAVVNTRELVEQITAAMARPCAIGDLRITASASIGVTPLNRASDLLQVMVNSDAAMYAAKSAGKLHTTRADTAEPSDSGRGMPHSAPHETHGAPHENHSGPHSGPPETHSGPHEAGRGRDHRERPPAELPGKNRSAS